MEAPRKKSPRAPSLSLDEAVDRTIRVYKKEHLHAAPLEVVATHIGYKTANSGSALSAIASLRYFGLLERPKEGLLAVSKDVESFQFAPSEELRRNLLIQFLRTPPLYGELLAKYEGGLPSDAVLKYELLQRGFMPAAASSALATFRKSVDFAEYYDHPNSINLDSSEEPSEPASSDEKPLALERPSQQLQAAVSNNNSEEDFDRIPVRLAGGRKAWLLIPTPFYEADKIRLKAQIDFLLAEDDES